MTGNVKNCLTDNVEGRCGEDVANTDWAACLVAEDDGGCPHGFLKIEDDHACTPRGYRSPPYKKRVCCVLTPVFDLKVRILPRLWGLAPKPRLCPISMRPFKSPTQGC